METKPEFDPYQVEKPDSCLFRYYVFVSMLSGPFMPIMLLPLYFRYVTLRYKFDDSGVSMQWGILFRKEVYLTYRRIQDIHLTRNILQRWMGLAKISLQTASGSSQAEMSIEGILEAEELRDFLYSRMRGAKDEGAESGGGAGADSLTSSNHNAVSDDRATKALEDIRDSLKQLVAAQQSGEDA
ncbi:MAG: PH domain-containing protein [Pirellulaceae bacterium]